MQEQTEWATIGKIVAPFGLRGEVKVFSLSDIPNRFAELEMVYLGTSHKRVRIESVRPYKGTMFVLKLHGVDDMNAAEALRDVELMIPSAELAHLPPDSYYQHDILGLQVLRLNGEAIGAIVEILPTGGNDVYVVRRADGRQALIPAIKQVVKQIDLVRRTMYIDPLPGLLDDETELDSGGPAEDDDPEDSPDE